MRSSRKLVSLLLVLVLFATMFIGLSLTANAAVTPVVWLKFDGNLNDSSGNNRNAVYKDGTEPVYVDGNVSKAVKFDHTLLEVQNTVGIDFSKAFSYSVWLKLDPDAYSTTYLKFPYGSSFSHRSGLGFDETSIYNEAYYQSLESPTQADLNVYELSYLSSSLTSEVHTDKYMHIVYSFDGKNYKYWIDGKLDSTGTLVDANHYGNGAQIANDANLLLGGDSGEWFNGIMDDLRIYNTALTNADVTTLNAANILSKGTNTMIVTLDLPNMMVNGVNQEIDPGRGTVAESILGRTRVPISSFLKVWGATPAKWDGATKKVTLEYKGIKIELWIDKNTAMVNGKSVQIDERDPLVVPMLKNGRTMLPLAFVMKQFSIAYEWKAETRQIHIFY